MEVAPFTDEYDQVARVHDRTVEQQRGWDDEQAQPPSRWVAVEDGVVVAAVTAWLRPDDRLFLSLSRDATLQSLNSSRRPPKARAGPCT